MSADQTSKIKRILVALDDSTKAIGLLRSAAELAETLDAELIGLFVEDIDLLRAAELPFFREIDLITKTRRRLDRRQIERILQDRAGEIRSEAERLLQETTIQWRFRIARGHVSEEIKNAAADVDLLIMARSTMSDRRLGSSARNLARAVPGNLLLLEPSAERYNNLVTIFDGSDKALHAMETAAHLAEAQAALLTIAVVADSTKTAKNLQREASFWLRDHGIDARFRWILPPQSTRLAEIVGSEGQCMLILPDESSLLEHEDISDLLSDLACPVFLVG